MLTPIPIVSLEPYEQSAKYVAGVAEKLSALYKALVVGHATHQVFQERVSEALNHQSYLNAGVLNSLHLAGENFAKLEETVGLISSKVEGFSQILKPDGELQVLLGPMLSSLNSVSKNLEVLTDRFSRWERRIIELETREHMIQNRIGKVEEFVLRFENSVLDLDVALTENKDSINQRLISSERKIRALELRPNKFIIDKLKTFDSMNDDMLKSWKELRERVESLDRKWEASYLERMRVLAAPGDDVKEILGLVKEIKKAQASDKPGFNSEFERSPGAMSDRKSPSPRRESKGKRTNLVSFRVKNSEKS